MTEIPGVISQIRTKRPVLVWMISIWYVLSNGLTFLSLLLTFSGEVPLNGAQKGYFLSQTPFDYGLAGVVMALNLIGAVLLFFLKKLAFRYFLIAFCFGIGVTIYQVLIKNDLSAVGLSGGLGILIGWGISIAIIAYSKRLIQRGILG